MNVSEFRINFILSPKLVVEKEKLNVDFFLSGIEQINRFQKSTLGKTEVLSDLDKHYIAAHEYSKNVLKYAQNSSLVELTTDGIKFSFGIENTREDFAQINNEGKRMWLRQYLEDHILHYTLPALLEKSFNWKEQLSVTECEKFKKLHEAFELSLDKAYDINNTTFCIDGE